MRHRILIFPIFFFILFSSCEVKNPVRDVVLFPELSEPSVPDSLFIGSDSGMTVSVRAVKPKDAGGIETVECRIYPSDSRIPVYSDSLKDDGLNGDVIPLDGAYTGRITGRHIGGLAGSYRIGFLAFDRNRNASDTVFVPFKAVAGKPNAAPELGIPVVPDTVRDEQLGSVFISIPAVDPDGSGDIDSVFCDAYPPMSVKPAVRLALHDDGQNGDAAGNDGIYSFRGDMASMLTVPGVYTLRFQSRDKGGTPSLPKVAKVAVVIPNQPPMLSHLSAPDVVSRNSSSPILITIQAQDRQGPADIKRVYFLSTKPDGTRGNNGNPILMSDDGKTGGDTIAGDGVYSVEIYITPQNALGDYRFEFFAEDLSGAVSEPVTHTITVVDTILD
jgi:hypothetical protein